jgi:sugar lactone lactonase YvrE
VVKVDLVNHTSTPLASGLGFSPGVDVGGNGRVLATSTLGAPGSLPVPDARLVRISKNGTVSVKANMLDYELAHNPDGQSQDVDAVSNPYSVLAVGDRTYVVDSAANDIIRIDASGHMSTVVVFPNITTGACAGATNNDPVHPGCDPVPTDVELGHDGYLYVSGLGAEVEGHIYKVNPRTGAIVRTWGGLPPLTGIAVDEDGTIYAASLFTDQVFRFKGRHMTTATVPSPSDVELGHGMLVVASAFTGDIYSVPRGAFS